MARRRNEEAGRTLPARAELVAKLVQELRANREYGQPFIDEMKYRTGKRRVSVIWDQWEGIPLQERTATILRAYEEAEGQAFRDTIALASGLTVPEAHEAGLLPVEIIPARRESDPITETQVRQAMLEEGATQLGGGSRKVRLFFRSREEAQTAKERLLKRFPQSENIWLLEWDFMPSRTEQGD